MTRTYRGRSPDEQKQFNQARKEKAMRATIAKRAKQPLPQDVEEVLLQVEAEDIQIPKLNWKDQILSRFQAADNEPVKVSTKQDKEHIENSSNLLSSVLPLTISGLIAIYARKMFSEEYQKCAPAREEVAAMLTPIFSILHRHIGIEGKASQDAIDFGAFLLAGLTMGTRMLMTADDIRRGTDDTNAQQASTGTSKGTTAAASGNSEAADHRTNGPVSFEDAASQYWTGANARNTRNGHGTESAFADTSSEASIMADLLRRDAEGRRQMGLAPRRISEGN